MLFFKRILDFKKDDEPVLDKRGAKRYTVGQKFPLKAKVKLIGRDGEGNILPPGHDSGMEWGGQVINLSSNGAGVRLHPAAEAAPGENCRLRLEIENKRLEFNGHLAQFWSNQQYATCGILLSFPNFPMQKAYLQLLEPVLIGASLAPMESKNVKPDPSGLKKEQYCGDKETVLNVWRNIAGSAVEYFELQMHDYFVRGSAQSPKLQAGIREQSGTGEGAARPAASINLSTTQTAELRQLFDWVVPNLAKAVPADVRAFLQRFTG